MIHIVSDSSTLYSPAQAAAAGFHCVPLSVCVNDETYRDYDEITPRAMADACRKGAKVSSSQPAVGEKTELYSHLLENPDDTVLDITIADGLSGTYTTACMARDLSEDPGRITVFNSRALGGPQRLMVETAVRMRNAGHSLEEILAVLLKMAESDVSTVTVSDLHFLSDGGRIPKGLAAVGSMLRVLPTVVRREDGQSLDTLAVSRTWKGAFGKVAAAFDKKGMDASNVIYILHADCEENAAKARSWFAARYPDSDIVVLDLCPMFMVHGGPGCLALETVKKA